jgi:hypothetical protein
MFRWFVGLVGVGVVGLAVMVPATMATNHVDLTATLHGGLAFPGAGGTSTYDRGGHVREVTVTVTGIPQLQGQRVTFFVAGKRIGSRLVTSGGTASIQRETIHGQFVPFASAGNKVMVRSASGELVAVGTYVRVRG